MNIDNEGTEEKQPNIQPSEIQSNQMPTGLMMIIIWRKRI